MAVAVSGIVLVVVVVVICVVGDSGGSAVAVLGDSPADIPSPLLQPLLFSLLFILLLMLTLLFLSLSTLSLLLLLCCLLPVCQAGIASNAMAHVSAALAGGSNYPGGIPGLAGLGVAGALAVTPASAAALAASKVMRELHVGGLPHGVSGVQLQVQ